MEPLNPNDAAQMLRRELNPNLMACPACQERISKAAPACPQCGHPFQAPAQPAPRFNGPPHDCSYCGGVLKKEAEATSEGSGCLVFLVGLLFTPLLIGIPVVLYGIHLMCKRKAYWRCKSCQQRFDRHVAWYELG